jgi:lantibiotic modifying enzyme
LRDLADEEEDGFAWFTGPDRIPNWQNDLYPRGYYNLGVAHGIPGVIAFLGDACEAGIARELAAPMLEGAVQWLLRRRLPATEVASFPNYVAPTTDEREFKLAWCYGDLGIAVTLLRAARATGNAQWEAAAIEIARRAALRPAQGSGVHDASLCHGAAGVAHLFNRLFQMTGDRTLRDAARFWFEHALDMKKPGEGIAGYAARFMNGKREVFWEADPGLLTGATGIALALLAAATNVEPQWDAMLLLSSPSGSIA